MANHSIECAIKSTAKKTTWYISVRQLIIIAEKPERLSVILVHRLSTNGRKVSHLRSSDHGQGRSAYSRQAMFHHVRSRCCKHLAIPIIRVVFAVQCVTNVSTVFHLLSIKNVVCSACMIITSRSQWQKARASRLVSFMSSSTYAPRCAKCAYPICPEEVNDAMLD